MSDKDLYLVDESESLEHYGTPRHSGRYPWGSGKDGYQRHGSFSAKVLELKKQGMTQKEIADGFGLTTRQLAAKVAMDRAAERQAKVNFAYRLKEKGMSNMEIGRRMGINESSVRELLNPSAKVRGAILFNTADALRESVKKDKIIDVGKGVERYLGISADKLAKSVAVLEEEGYEVHHLRVKQVTTGQYTEMRILAPPGMSKKYVLDHLTDTKLPFEYSQDGGLTYKKKEPINNIDGSRVFIRYNEDGGVDRDGTIELRRGVEDLSLGQSHYAQVRIGVDGTHYLKGMAHYSDNIPDGYDIVFNTNKHRGTAPGDVFKPQKDTGDPSNPFGSAFKDEEKLTTIQRHYIGKDGKEHLSALNIVKEEGDVGEWSKSLASQVLSKQDPQLAKRQLKLASDFKQQEFDDIMALTNPVVKKKLLESFADSCDSDAVHLKAAALPRQASHVILPVVSMKENEIYAPNYNNGEEVVLIRYPHGGIFEIPRLKVNNKNKEAESIMGKTPKDAVGINPKVAAQLSGADFDGDTVVVIPTKGYQIKSSSPLKGLKEFEPKEAYPQVEGMKIMSKKNTQIEMGKISNLITDMTIKGATPDELARAVRHSMVVIDAAKHKLNYKQSEVDNGIKELKAKYQPEGGSATLISRAKSPIRITKRKTYYKIDPKTGEKIFEETPEFYTDKKTGKLKERTVESTKMYETKDARELSSGTVIEEVYASYANQMKALGDKARLASLSTGSMPQSATAKKTYAAEVESLNTKLNNSLKNAPIERQAQLLANKTLRLKIDNNPEIKDDGDAMKKAKNAAIADARARLGAKKTLIDITDKEWEAIQAGAITKTKLEEIIKNADEQRVKELATPRQNNGVSEVKQSMIKSLAASGYTQAEIAERLGITTSTVNKYV